MVNDQSLLLHIPVDFKLFRGKLWVERQALNGLRCWSDNFERLTVCAPVQHEDPANDPSNVWDDPSELLANRNITLVPLPWGYHPLDFIKYRKSVIEEFQKLIPQHRYLSFADFGWPGAWSNEAAQVAIEMGREYSVWFDLVIHQMPLDKNDRSLKSIVKQFIGGHYAKWATYKFIRASKLGLFHGKTVYDAYAPLCKQPELVHCIHIKPEDAISDSALDQKLDSIQSRKNLKIGYIGRVIPMKGPSFWLDTVEKLISKVGGDRVDAVWLGGGSQLEEMIEAISNRGLQNTIKFPGFVSDRQTVIEFLKNIDVFLFCHVTPESPRCLIEALISATPIIGFESAYAQDIVGARGGALLSKIGDTETLVNHLYTLMEDREKLAELVTQAASNRLIYNDDAVFAHRSDLIKKYLP